MPSFSVQARAAILANDLAAAQEMLDQASVVHCLAQAAYDLAREAVVEASVNRAPFLRLALDNGARVNELDASGDDLLTRLCQNSSNGDDSDELAKMLIQHGAAVNPAFDDEDADPPATPLMLAAASNCEHLVQFLLDNGADLEALDGNLETALFHAVRGRSIDAVEVLIRHGANVSGINSSQMSPLYSIFGDAMFEDEEDEARAIIVAAQLIGAGADLDAPGLEGETTRQLLDNFNDELRNEVIGISDAKRAADQADALQLATRPAPAPRTRRVL